MSKIEIYGDPGYFSGSYQDDGKHYGHTLAPCPFCGKDDELEIANTHTAIFWIQCECGAEMTGQHNDDAQGCRTEAEALKEFEAAMLWAVDDWNSRRG
ncbi:Lar family restriction alleviation protein [Salmonella enterica]